MTDESPDDENLLVHHHEWRSTGTLGIFLAAIATCSYRYHFSTELNDLVRSLDDRYVRHSSTSQHHHPPLKPRQDSTPSQRPPPVGAPEWAVVCVSS